MLVKNTEIKYIIWQSDISHWRFLPRLVCSVCYLMHIGIKKYGLEKDALSTIDGCKTKSYYMYMYMDPCMLEKKIFTVLKTKLKNVNLKVAVEMNIL